MAVLPQRISAFLGKHAVPYDVIAHRCDAAQEAATDTQFAKTVTLWADGRFLIVILPADHKADLAALREALGVRTVNLATAEELATLYPDCEPDAVPPFGPLYQMSVYVSADVLEYDTITFTAGTHDKAIRMRYSDFDRLVWPHIMAFSQHVEIR